LTVFENTAKPLKFWGAGRRRLRRRGIPPAKIRKDGEAAPLTISSFSLAAYSFILKQKIQ